MLIFKAFAVILTVCPFHTRLVKHACHNFQQISPQHSGKIPNAKYTRETVKMNLKNTRLISFLLILALSFQLTACVGKAGGDSFKPDDALSSLTTSVRDLKKDDLLDLLKIDKDSSVYKEYSDLLDLGSYSADAAKCYKAVASNIEISYDDSSAEAGSDIVKVKVAFKIPDWKAVFEDGTLSGAESIVEKLEKADKNEDEITLRLIKGQDGYKIKNYEDLMEIFGFIGSEIKALLEDSKPTETSKPTEPSETSKETAEPSESSAEPSESSSETNEPKPTSGKKGTEDDIARAYADYAKRLQQNKDGIEWFEKNVNKNSCGLVDITGDDIPDLYYFTKNASDSNSIALFIYSYDPAKQKSAMILLDTLVDAESKIAEYAVFRTKAGQVISYRGYLDENGSITEYNIYSSKGTGHFMEYTGKMFLTLGPAIKDKNGNDMQMKICTVQGVDKYKASTKVEVDEFRRIEKDLFGSSESVFSAKYQKSFNSIPYQAMGGKKSSAVSCDELLKKLS